MLFTCYFFLERFLCGLRTFRLLSVWDYLRGRFDTLYVLGVEHFVVIVSHRLLSQKVPSWVFGGVMNGSLSSNVISQMSQWHEKYIVCFICYLYWQFVTYIAIIQFKCIEFNGMDQLHAFYLSSQRWIQRRTFNICVGAFLQFIISLVSR